VPVYSRKVLRRSLGQNGLRDTYVGTTTLSLGANAAVAVMDRVLADAFFSSSKYQRAWVLVASVQYRTASYNFQSGSVMSGQLAVNAIASGMDFELHEILPPDDKDRCIDDVVGRIRVRREVGFPSRDGLEFYALDGVASPHTVKEVLNAYYFANPTNSLNRDRRDFVSKVPVQTATGLELRISPPVPSGYQIAIDAILTLSLGSGDAATVDIPDEKIVQWGARAKAYDLLMRQTPGQQSDTYKQDRQDAAREFSRLAALNKAQVSRTLQFDTVSNPIWWVE
jgi:hypothetical protein